MSWFPTFLNWQVAAIAAAIAIPALLVLYFLKLRRREMAVSSTLLWKKAIQDLQVNAPFQKLRRNLLLLLQLLLLAAAAARAGRPVANYTPAPGKTTVILIDRSASMAAKDADGKHAARRGQAAGEGPGRRRWPRRDGDGHRVRRHGRDDAAVHQRRRPAPQARSTAIQPTDRKTQAEARLPARRGAS